MLKSLATPIEWIIPDQLLLRLIKRLPFNKIRYGSLTFHYMGLSHRYEGVKPGNNADITITHLFRFIWLILSQGELGFAQAYIEGTMSSSSLYRLMQVIHKNNAEFTETLNNKKNIGWLNFWQHKKRHNSVRNSRKNIAEHYDLGNKFYSLWLDDSMSYSSGLYEHDDDSLALAQTQKYQRILNQLQLQPNDTVLEIGCGWGAFAELAIKQGASVKGLTLSHEQQAFTQQRLENQSLAKRADIALQDYRHEVGTYDHIVSIEMFEAVGKEYWSTYFQQLKKNLNLNGKAVLQVITIDELYADDYQKSVDFIQAYVFPGGLLPSFSQLNTLAGKHDFHISDVDEFGQDYEKTLHEWLIRFNQQSETLCQHGYDHSFQRLWRYYLDYCRVGFSSGHISVYQLTLTHKH